MSLSDFSKFKGRVKKRPTTAPAGKMPRWSDSQKIEAVTTYLLLGGNATQTAAVLKIPHDTLQHWRKTEWWQEVEKDIKQTENLLLSNKLKKLVDKSLVLMEDRLDKGDFIYDQKSGRIKRKPVTLRDVTKVATDLLNQKQQIEVGQNHIVDQENVNEKLKKLAQSFEQFAAKQAEKPPLLVTDVVFIENKHDQESEYGDEVSDNENENDGGGEVQSDDEVRGFSAA